MPDTLNRRRSYIEALRHFSEEIQPDTPIITEHTLATSIGWALGRHDSMILFDAGELMYGLEDPEQAQRHIASRSEFDELVSKVDNSEKENRLVFLVRANNREHFFGQLPPPKEMREFDNIIMAVY